MIGTARSVLRQPGLAMTVIMVVIAALIIAICVAQPSPSQTLAPHLPHTRMSVASPVQRLLLASAATTAPAA